MPASRLLRSLLTVTLTILPTLATAAPKALFDNTHAETAGNADWQIDTDQPLPVPDQGTVTAATARTYWLGAISSWGIDLVKRGYFVATLTTTYGITYGNGANPYDLSNYDVFIVDEPNKRFSSAESTAIFHYVRDGGGLVAVSDHDISDRDNDGFDSPRIWDRLDAQHFFGAHFDTTGEANNNFSQNSGNAETSPADSIIHGPNGVADSVSYHNGASMILYPGVNPSVTGDIWMNGQTHGTTNVMVAHAVYGNGRIVWVGDSSPADDGSATPGNSSIFDGWGEASGRDSLLFQNATMWATRRTLVDLTPPSVTVASPNGGELWKAGSTHAITWVATDDIGVTSVDLAWSGDGGATYPYVIATGIANTGTYAWPVPNAPTITARVQVTAHDATGHAGLDASDAGFAIDTWIITATAGANGTVAPSGSVEVAEGANQSFLFTPTAGYRVATLMVDGSEVPAAPGYDFTSVTSNHTLAVTFADSTAPNVNVTSPNGGEEWVEGSVHDITWSAGDNVGVDSIDVDVSLHGPAGPWIPIAHGLANSGTVSWTTPLEASDSASVRVQARDTEGNTTSDASDSLFRIMPEPTAVAGETPLRFLLGRTMPNPSRDGATLRFTLAASAETRLEILDLAGRRVRVLLAGALAAGGHVVAWDGRDAAGHHLQSGIYFVRLASGPLERWARIVRL